MAPRPRGDLSAQGAAEQCAADREAQAERHRQSKVQQTEAQAEAARQAVTFPARASFFFTFPAEKNHTSDTILRYTLFL